MPTQRERNAVQSADRMTQLPLDKHSSQQQRYAIRLAFDGTTYQGFQSQPYKNTIQDQIEYRLQGLLRRPVRIVAWGRTDSGVHAKGAVVTVDITLDEVYRFANKKTDNNTASSAMSGNNEGGNTKERDESECQTAVDATAKFLHSVLIQFACNSGDTPQPQSRYGSISALAVKPVPLDFDARYSALWKRYVYYVCATTGNGENVYTDDQTLSPFAYGRYAWIIRQSLHLNNMIKAANTLNDTEHNFDWMAVMQQGELRDSLRKVQLCIEQVPNASMSGGGDVPYFLQQNGNTTVYKITVESDFFLYKMVRRIVGILVAIGKNDADLDELTVCIDEHDKRYHDVDATTSQTKIKVPTKLLQTAPAKGLCLDHVEYDIPI